MKRTPIVVSFAAVVAFVLTAANANAVLVGQLGVIDPATVNGGINPTTSNPWQAGDQYRLAFVSSTGTPATSTNIGTYNTFVQNLANAAGLGGTNWNVAGSTAAVDARDNTGTNPNTALGVSLLRLDGTVLANNNADIWNGLAAGLNVNENLVGGLTGDVFTGSNGNGTAVGGVGSRVLGGSSENPPRVRVGRMHVGSQWMVIFNQAAANPFPVYAISDPLTIREQQDPGGPVTPEPASVALAMLGLGGLVMRRRK